MSYSNYSAPSATLPLGSRLVSIGERAQLFFNVLGYSTLVLTFAVLVIAFLGPPGDQLLTVLLSPGFTAVSGALMIVLGQAFRWGLTAVAELLESHARIETHLTRSVNTDPPKPSW